MNYVIGTGYFSGGRIDPRKQAELWLCNTLRWTQPKRIVVISQEREDFPPHPLVDVVRCPGNPGHVHNLLGIEPPLKPHEYGGWSASVLALAMIAYCSECDFVYKESDCFLFGDCIDKMYEACSGGIGMVFGKYEGMPCAQSLFLVRHRAIPRFIHDYLSLGDDRSKHNLPEHKFRKLMMRAPSRYSQFSFGYDRERPRAGLASCSDPAWYVQQLNPQEVETLIACGRL